MYLLHTFKQNKLKLLIWSIVLIGMNVTLAPVFKDILGRGDGLESLKQTLDNPAMVALVGPIPESAYTYAVAYSHEMLLFMALTHAIFNILIARDVSKKEETSGMTEVLLSNGIRKPRLMTTYIVYGLLINIFINGFVYIGLTLLNIETFSDEGNLLYATGLALFGFLFYALTLLSANIFESSEMTFGIPLTLLIGFYLYRAITDVSHMEYSVFSPFNWLTRTFPYSMNEWIWLVPFAIIPPILIVTYLLFMKRDLGSGLLRARDKKHARRIYSYPILLLRTSSVSIVSWLVGMLIIGLTYGSVFKDLNDLIHHNEVLKIAVEQGSIQDPTLFFIHMIMLITTVISAIPALILFNKLGKFEKDKLLEVVNTGTLNKKFNRAKVILTHVIIAVLFGVVIQLVSAIGMHLASMNVETLKLELIDYLKASLNFSVVILFVVALGMLLYGIGRNLFKAIWLYLGYLFFIAYMGTLIDLPKVLHALTPFHYLSESPSDSVEMSPIFVTAGISMILVVCGLLLFNKRDLN